MNAVMKKMAAYGDKVLAGEKTGTAEEEGFYVRGIRHQVIDFTMEAAKIYAKIQADCVKKGRTRPVFDLLIASTAIASNLILATCNYKDFKDITGLIVEDWLH